MSGEREITPAETAGSAGGQESQSPFASDDLNDALAQATMNLRLRYRSSIILILILNDST